MRRYPPEVYSLNHYFHVVNVLPRLELNSNDSSMLANDRTHFNGKHYSFLALTIFVSDTLRHHQTLPPTTSLMRHLYSTAICSNASGYANAVLPVSHRCHIAQDRSSHTPRTFRIQHTSSRTYRPRSVQEHLCTFFLWKERCQKKSLRSPRFFPIWFAVILIETNNKYAIMPPIKCTDF